MPTPFPDPGAAFALSFGTDPKVIVEVLPQPALLTETPAEPSLDPEPGVPLAPASRVADPLEPELELLPEPLLDAGAPAPLAPELLPELPEPDVLPEVGGVAIPEPVPLPEGEVMPAPVLPVLAVLSPPGVGAVPEPLAPLPHATTIQAKHAGMFANLRGRRARPMLWYCSFMSTILSGTLDRMPK